MTMTIELCRHLRWKSATREIADAEAIGFAFARNQVPYTCLHTCQPWGPDDELVVPELCHSQRNCFEPSALTKRSSPKPREP